MGPGYGLCEDWLGPLTSFSLLFCRTGHYPERPALWSYTWSRTAERCHGQGVCRRGRAVHGLLTEGLCHQFQKLGSREAVRRRVLEVVNHVDKVPSVSTLGGLPGGPPPAGASRTPSNTGPFWTSPSLTEPWLSKRMRHLEGGVGGRAGEEAVGP